MAKLKKIRSSNTDISKTASANVKEIKKDRNSDVKIKKSAKTNGSTIHNVNIKPKSSLIKTETLALDKTQQKDVVKVTKKIKKDLKEGNLVLKNNVHKERRQKRIEKRGLIYIGHLPHGFYEDEIRNYFKQFGKVTNVKVCRSRISGNSKGYGYVEFLSPEVAKIAAESMNNYVMFMKRLVCEFVPYEKRPLHLFDGKSSNLIHTSAKTRRGKQRGTRNNFQEDHKIKSKSARSFKKLRSKIAKLQNLGIQCDIKPVGLTGLTAEIEEKVIKKEVDSKASIRASLPIKSLSKSLDSITVKKSNRKLMIKDEETQTIKKEKTDGVLKGGIRKDGKKMKPAALKLDKKAVQMIARELIRKRGNPLLNLRTVQSRKKKN